MDPVHDRGSMDPVHESGPWTRSKVGAPWTPGPCFVLTPDGMPVDHRLTPNSMLQVHIYTEEKKRQTKLLSLRKHHDSKAWTQTSISGWPPCPQKLTWFM